MKTKHSVRFLAILLCVCMAAGILPIVFAEDAPATPANATAKDYDTAADGDLLWTVDFNFGEIYQEWICDDALVTGLKITDTEAGHGTKLTFTNKAADSNGYYGGDIPMYPIDNRVYTISWYTENTDPATIRQASQFSCISIKGNNYRVGINTVKSSAFEKMMLILNGSNLEYLSPVSRQADTENKNRQYFQMVMDGVSRTMRFYALNTDGEYQMLQTYKFDELKPTAPCLTVGMFTWDGVLGNNEISMADVQIFKGDQTNNPTKDYRAAYDQAKDGDVLYKVNFSDIEANRIPFSKVRDYNYATIDGYSVKFTYNTKSTAQIFANYLPDPMAHTYGSYTYEFYVSAEKRVTFGVLAMYNDYRTADLDIGFSYFNPDPSKMFMNCRGWTDVNNTTLTGAPYNCTLTVHDQQQNPKTGEGIACNVKIEVDTANKVIHNYILTDNGFVKTASIGYEGTKLAPAIYLYAYDSATNAEFRDLVIRKGLTAGLASAETCVKAEALQVGAVRDGKVVLRFVGSGMQADFNRLGFEVTATVGEEARTFGYKTRIGVRKLTGTALDSTLTEMTAESVGAAYLFGYTLTDVPATGTVTFTVRPYSLLDDGSVRYGATVTYTLENGILK